MTTDPPFNQLVCSTSSRIFVIRQTEETPLLQVDAVTQLLLGNQSLVARFLMLYTYGRIAHVGVMSYYISRL